MAEIIVVNVVASASIGKELMLQDIAFQLEGAEYDQDRFPGLIYKLAEPKTAVLIFSDLVFVDCNIGKSEGLNFATIKIYIINNRQ